MNKRVIVIGGGIGGLATAVRLARAGLPVVVLEKLARVGGMLNRWEIPHPGRPNDRPFRFDTGPTRLTMPFVFMDLFAAAGEDVRDHLRIRKLDPVTRFCWPDGSRFELRADAAALHQEISRLSPGDAPGWARLLEHGRRTWDLIESLLIHAPEQLIRDAALRSLATLFVPFRIGLFSSYARAIDRRVRSRKLRDVLYHYAACAGACPLSAPATLLVIPWIEHYFGAWHIEGGMYRLAEQLERVARKLGVEIRTDTTVLRIQIEGRVARGVKLHDGAELAGDAVIANCDAVYAHRHLIAPEHRSRFPDAKLDRLDPAPSAFVLMLGIEGIYPQLAHHNRLMPEDYRSELRAIFDTQTIPQDPAIHVCSPTRADPGLAPEGCDALFILAAAPSLKHSTIDWSIEGPRYRDKLIRILETRWKLTDLSKRIVVEKMMTPADLRQTYNANAGSMCGIARSSIRSALLRPPNRSRDIKRLYFAGGATHPGGGLSLAALSGKIVSKLVADDLQPAIITPTAPPWVHSL